MGARTVEDIGERCGAGTNCGGCIPLIEDILESKLVALISEAEQFEAPVESTVTVRTPLRPLANL